MNHRRDLQAAPQVLAQNNRPDFMGQPRKPISRYPAGEKHRPAHVIGLVRYTQSHLGHLLP